MEDIDQTAVKQLTKAYLSNLDIYPIPIIMIDVDDKICAMNHYACTLHRCNDANPIGLSYTKLCNKYQLSNMLAECLASLKTKLKPHNVEVSYSNNNKQQWIKWDVIPMGGKQNAFAGVILLGTDITWEKMYRVHLERIRTKTEKLLGKDSCSHATVQAYFDDVVDHYDNIIGQMPGYVYWKDLAGHYLGVNNNVVAMVNMPSRQACIGKTDTFLAKRINLPDKVLQSFRKDDQYIAETGQPLINKEDQPFTNFQGNEVNHLTNKIPLYNQKKQLRGILGISIDITERKKLIKLKQENQILHQDLENIIDNLAGYVYWKDRQGTYIRCNKQTAKIWNLKSPDQVTGKTDYELAKLINWPKEFPDRWARDDKKVMETGIPLLNQEEEPITDFEGKVIYQLSTRIPLRNKKGEIIGVLGNSLDITDKKKVESLEKEVTERTITQLMALSGGIAHQITNPLAGIKAAFEYIQYRLPKFTQSCKKVIQTGVVVNDKSLLEEADKIDTLIHQINQRIDKTSYIIEHHLINIKSNQKHISLNIASTQCYSISIIVEEALAEFTFIEQQAKLIHWENSNDFSVMGEKRLLIHVLFNLLGNALESIHEAGKLDGKIYIWLDNKGDDFCLNVKDTGLGLPHNGRTQLFNPFYTSRQNGTGLGLYFCKNVMQAHNGNILVRGEIGKYAQFTLKFPAPNIFWEYQKTSM